MYLWGNDSTVRTTLSLEDDVYQAAKALADAAGENLGTVVSALARKALKSQADFAVKNGLPVFQMPADAPLIPGDQAARIMAGEEK